MPSVTAASGRRTAASVAADARDEAVLSRTRGRSGRATAWPRRPRAAGRRAGPGAAVGRGADIGSAHRDERRRRHRSGAGTRGAAPAAVGRQVQQRQAEHPPAQVEPEDRVGDRRSRSPSMARGAATSATVCQRAGQGSSHEERRQRERKDDEPAPHGPARQVRRGGQPGAHRGSSGGRASLRCDHRIGRVVAQPPGQDQVRQQDDRAADEASEEERQAYVNWVAQTAAEPDVLEPQVAGQRAPTARPGGSRRARPTTATTDQDRVPSGARARGPSRRPRCGRLPAPRARASWPWLTSQSPRPSKRASSGGRCGSMSSCGTPSWGQRPSHYSDAGPGAPRDGTPRRAGGARRRTRSRGPEPPMLPFRLPMTTPVRAVPECSPSCRRTAPRLPRAVPAPRLRPPGQPGASGPQDARAPAAVPGRDRPEADPRGHRGRPALVAHRPLLLDGHLLDPGHGGFPEEDRRRAALPVRGDPAVAVVPDLAAWTPRPR